MVTRARWREFELPTRIMPNSETITDEFGAFIAEPFERGFGSTLGNSLRRVLLSSLEGSAVTSIKIEGVDHEFTTVKGVYEDVTDIVLNIKQLLLEVESTIPQKLVIDVEKEGEVTAADIECPANVTISNPDLVICTLTSKTKFRLEMEACRGRGYVTAAEQDTVDHEIGRIPVDSIFSPVRRVNFRTEDTRVGQATDYDKLHMEIWTDGTVTPEMALVEASKILRKHLNPFVMYFEVGRETAEEEPTLETAVETEEPEPKEDIGEKFRVLISDLDLSVRASNCLEAEDIRAVGDLVKRTEDDMLNVRNFGQTSLREIKRKLDELGLNFGMKEMVEQYM